MIKEHKPSVEVKKMNENRKKAEHLRPHRLPQKIHKKEGT